MEAREVDLALLAIHYGKTQCLILTHTLIDMKLSIA